MSHISSIALPTDLADDCAIVFSHAVKLALETHARLRLIHVHPRPAEEIPWTRLPTIHDTLVRWGLLAEDAGVPEYNALGLHIRADHWVANDPADGAVAALQHDTPDLLIVGTHRRQGLSRILNGSVAEAIARRAKLHTLFVGRDTRGFVDPATGVCSLSRVLVPVSDDVNLPAVMSILDGFLDALHPGTVEVTLLTVNNDFDLEVGEVMEGSRVSFTVERRSGPIVETILSVAEAMDTQLICMPTEDRDSLSDMLLGTKTEQVLHTSRCPLLTLRDHR